MALLNAKSNAIAMLFSLSLPLLTRFYADGTDASVQRLALLGLAFFIAYGWSAIFGKHIGRPPNTDQAHFAMLFALLLPEPVGWGGAAIALSFGWVFGREVFGGRAIVPPVLISLAFAVFSFTPGTYEIQSILYTKPDLLLAIACLPGAAILIWKKSIVWSVVVGVAIGVAIVAGAMPSPSLPPWWEHVLLGTFSVGILFIAASVDYAPRTNQARLFYGVLVGALIAAIRLTNPDQPDGIIFAVLLGALFAPLLDRMWSWGKRDG